MPTNILCTSELSYFYIFQYRVSELQANQININDNARTYAHQLIQFTDVRAAPVIISVIPQEFLEANGLETAYGFT